MHDLKLTANTDGTGAATVDGPLAICGKLYAIQVLIGTLASGAADLTISVQGHDASKTLLTLTNISANGLYYPRDLVHDATGNALTGTGGGDRALPLCVGVPRVVVADGGASHTGSVIFFWED